MIAQRNWLPILLAVCLALVLPVLSYAQDEPPQISQQHLENATYPTEVGDISLNDGTFVQEIGDGASSTTWLLGESAFGELDGDNVDDAVTILIQDTAGTGTFYYLYAMRNNDGSPEYIADLFLGDRIDLNSLEIIDNSIVIDYVRSGPNDPLCCPTMQVVETYQISAVLEPTHITRSLLENATYPTEAGDIPLEYGFYLQMIVPEGASNTTWLLGESAFGDLDEDGIDDAVAVLIENTAGSGTFYYLYVMRYSNGKIQYTADLLLGDRIELNSLEIVDNEIVIDYAQRDSDTSIVEVYQINDGVFELIDN